MWDKIIETLSKADVTVLFVVIIGFIAFMYKEHLKNNNLNKRLDDLEEKIFNKHQNLGEDISERHIGLGSDVLGKYKNLGEKISSEHMTIKKDTKNVFEMMLLEKQNREKLYENTSRAKEILDTMDLMKEVVNQNARLSQEVANLKEEDKNLSITKAKDNSEKLQRDLMRFESKLAEFESYKGIEEIQSIFKQIRNQLSEYDG